MIQQLLLRFSEAPIAPSARTRPGPAGARPDARSLWQQIRRGPKKMDIRRLEGMDVTKRVGEHHGIYLIPTLRPDQILIASIGLAIS